LTETKKETVPIAKGTMCQEDPGNDMCSDEKSEFTSSCTDGAVVQECKGDAIQCAIAKEQARQWCRLLQDEGGALLAAVLREEDWPRRAGLREAVGEVVAYLERHAHREWEALGDHERERKSRDNFARVLRSWRDRTDLLTGRAGA